MAGWLEPPTTRYARVGDADVAYKVTDSGSFDLLYFAGLGAHVDLSWDRRVAGGFYTRLASFSRLITFDRRGTGASDGVPRNAIPTWEEWTEDVGAVLDAVGSERAAVVAQYDAGPIAILFAAMHPDRVSALVLLGSTARFLAAPDYPIGISLEGADRWADAVERLWGTPLRGSDLSGDADLVDYWAMQTRASATPRTAAAQFRYLLTSLDVRQALPLVQAPTLILDAKNARSPWPTTIEHGHYLASHIQGAKLVEKSGQTKVSVRPDNASMLAADIEEFLTGHRSTVAIDRVLTTVLFTDIVRSTERAASLGDEAWGSLLDAHDHAVREQLRTFRGQEINTTGDGFVASFDGPARAIRCARAISDATARLGIDVRAGLHTGECEVRGDDLAGLAVHIAARVGSLATPGEVVVSSTVKDLVIGSSIEFEDRGEHTLKGVPGTWRLYSVAP